MFLLNIFVSVLTSFSFPIPFIFFFLLFSFYVFTLLHHSQLLTTSVPAFETVDQTKMKLIIALCLMCISYVAANFDCKSMSLELIQTCASCGKFAYGQNVETRDEYFENGKPERMKNCQECKDYMKCMYEAIEQVKVVVLSQALTFEGITAKQINTPETKNKIANELRKQLKIVLPAILEITSIKDRKNKDTTTKAKAEETEKTEQVVTLLQIRNRGSSPSELSFGVDINYEVIVPEGKEANKYQTRIADITTKQQGENNEAEGVRNTGITKVIAKAANLEEDIIIMSASEVQTKDITLHTTFESYVEDMALKVDDETNEKPDLSLLGSFKQMIANMAKDSSTLDFEDMAKDVELPSSFFSDYRDAGNDANGAEPASLMSLTGGNEILKPLNDAMKETVDAVRNAAKNIVTGGRDAKQLLKDLNVMPKMTSIIKDSISGNSQMKGLLELALDTSPLTKIYEELEIKKLRDIIQSRFMKVIGDDTFKEEEKVEGNLMKAITDFLSVEKATRVGNKALAVLTKAMFGGGDTSAPATGTGSSMIELEASKACTCKNRNFDPVVTDGKCECVAKNPAIAITFGLSLDVLKLTREQKISLEKEIGGRIELAAGFGLGITMVIPLNCAKVKKGRAYDPEKDDICKKKDQGQIVQDVYFVFAAGNGVGVGFTMQQFKTIVEHFSFTFLGNGKSTKASEECRTDDNKKGPLKIFESFAADFAVGMMFDHTESTGGGWGIDIGNPFGNVLPEECTGNVGNVCKTLNALTPMIPSKVSIGLEDGCNTASDGSRLGVKVNWGGDKMFNKKVDGKRPDIDGFNIHWDLDFTAVLKATVQGVKECFEIYENNQCTKKVQGATSFIQVSTCGARPGAPEKPGDHCTAGKVNDDFSKLESKFPERFHSFLQISEKPIKDQPCRNLQATCKAGGPGISPENGVAVLLKDASRYQPVFNAMLDNMLKLAEVGKIGEIEITKVGNKGKGRCLEKINQKYGCADQYGVRQLSDVTRGSIVFSKQDDLCKFVNAHLKKPKGKLEIKIKATSIDPKTNKQYKEATLEITNSKNRFRENAAGMRDLLVNVRMKIEGDVYGHVGELQIHHNAMVHTKHDFHSVYSYTRRIDEARKMIKIKDTEIFCNNAEKCQKYWIDHRNVQSDQSEKSTLDIMWNKWVVCDEAEVIAKNPKCGTQASSKPNTREYWFKYVRPFLRLEWRGSDGVCSGVEGELAFPCQTTLTFSTLTFFSHFFLPTLFYSL